MTPSEQTVVDDRKTKRARMAALIEALAPACMADGDHPLRDLGGTLRDVSLARETAPPIFRRERLSGTGGTGSALVISPRTYDGASGGAPSDYLCCFVECHDAAGYRVRTRGVTIRESEARAVGLALLAWIDGRESRARMGS